MDCPVCGNPNRHGAKFCDNCGAPLEQVEAPAPDAPPRSSDSDLEGAPESVGEGRYRIEGYLGSGGRKRVYSGTDTEAERPVAIALFDATAVAETARTRARRESQAMGQLGIHPRIVTVFDFGEQDDRPFIVSELVTGGDLADLLDAAPGRKLAAQKVVAIASDVCEGLEHAHGCGVFHRDLKPANIWLDADGRAEIGDFGLATSSATSESEVGALVGTVAYLPPEQAMGRHAGAASDLYSLGALLYEMLCGQPPFQGEDAVAVISSHLNSEPVKPSVRAEEVPPGLERLIMQLLQKDPADRPADAASVRAALESIDLEEVGIDDPVDAAMSRLAGGVFVGREDELTQLRASADQALGGQGGLVTLVGEPGIGKTRTLDEVATYVRVRGARVHRGHSHESEGAPAYWPWIEAIRSYVREADPVGLAWELGSGSEDIARLVPEVNEKLGRDPVASNEEGEQDRFRIFDSIARFLTSAARTRPLVIVLEDVHWADEPTLQLLRFIAAESLDAPLLVIATYRDVELGRHHPLAGTLGDLSSLGQTQKIVLRGLTLPSIERYMELTLGEAPPPRLAEAVHDQTDGNPFFVAETVRLLAADGSFAKGDAANWDLAIPQGVRELIGRRLDQLPREVNDMLATAAAIGREFETELLAASWKGSTKKLERGLDAAAAAEVLVRHGPNRFSFTHALIRETLYAELSSAARVKVHGRIADQIERQSDNSSRISELAHHYFEAAAGGNVERAIEYSVRAGRQACGQLAHEEAADHLARALELIEDDPERDIEISLELGDAQIRAGRFRAARESLSRAAELARELDSHEGLVGAALLLSQVSEAGGTDEELVTIYQQALDHTLDDGARSRLLSALAQEMYWSDPQGKARPLVEEALEIARRIGDEEAQVLALAGRQFLLVCEPQSLQDRIDNSRELLELTRRAGGTEARIRAHAYYLTMMFQARNMPEVDSETRKYAELASKTREPRHLWHIPLIRATRAIMDGDFALAREMTEQARRMGERAEEPLSQQFNALQLTLINTLEGNAAEMLPVVREMAARFPAVRAWRMSLVSFLCEADRLEEARAEFEPLAFRDFNDIPIDAQWLAATTRLADAAYRLGDVERSRILYEMLKPFAGEAIIVGRSATCNGVVDRYLGQLALTRGRPTDAVEHLARGVELSNAMGDRPFTADTQIHLAQALLARDSGGDRDRALSLLRDGIDAAQEMGMRTRVEAGLRLRLEAQGVTGLDTTDSIDSVALAAEQDAADISAHAAADGTVSILFSDIENSTLMTERLGDERWIELLRAHNEIFRERISAHNGYEVKNQGDGFMLAFPDPVEALAAAVEIQRDFDVSRAPTEERIRIRMGIHVGEAIVEDGDFFGRTVILAARIAAQARGGEVLVSDDLRKAAEFSAPDRFGFGGSARLELKGLAGTHTAHRLEWQPEVAATAS